jgi:cytosine/adenosine deaminase-related metal-dependent hydrolase
VKKRLWGREKKRDIYLSSIGFRKSSANYSGDTLINFAILQFIMKVGIEGGRIVAFDGTEHRLLEDGIVVYEGDTIVHVGKSYSGSLNRKIDARKRLVIPGLVNIHSHFGSNPYSKSYRGDGSTREVYNSDLFDRGKAFGASITKEEYVNSVSFSLARQLKSGVTTVVEMGSVDALGDKESVDLTAKSGIRAYLLKAVRSGTYYTEDGHDVKFTNFDGNVWDDTQGFTQLKGAMDFIREYDGSHGGRIKSFLYPSAVYNCSPDIFREVRRLANENNLLISSHVSEAALTFREMIRRHGKTPTEHLADLGILGPDFISGHSIIVSGHSKSGYADPWDRDIALLADTGSTVAHCPIVFSRYGIAMESYSKFLRMGVNVGIGTDSFPQDLLREMRLASTLSKVVEGEASVATSLDIFNSVTICGADALHRQDIGRITVGAKADLILIKLDSFNMAPLRDPIRNLVQLAESSDVDMVIVDGETLVEDGRVLRFDEEKNFEAMQRSLNEICVRIPEKDRLGRTIEDLMAPTLKKWE